MTSWKIERLEKLCTIHTGGTPSRQNPEYFLGNIPWITTVALGPLHIDEKKAAAFLTDEAVQGSAAKIIPPSSLLVGIRVGVGKTSINDCEIATNQDIAALTNIDDRCDIDYLQRVLRNYRSYFDLIKRGATIQGITTEVLRQLDVPLPPIEIQRKIAAVLDKAQELIDLRKAQLEKMDEFLRSVFLDMFGDPVTNPKGWEKKKLGVVGSLKRGMSKHRPRNAPELLGGPYPLIQTGDVSNAGIYIRSFTQTYSELGLQQSKMWPCGTLCITIAANIAKTGILKFDACFPDSVVGFVPLSSEVNKEFVHYWFSFFQQIIEAAAPESAQKNINLKILEEQNIVVPPLHLQTRFAAIVEATEAQKALMQQSLTEMENNFNSLMQQAFRGELF